LILGLDSLKKGANIFFLRKLNLNLREEESEKKFFIYCISIFSGISLL
jgi:hypothetical protein